MAVAGDEAETATMPPSLAPMTTTATTAAAVAANNSNEKTNDQSSSTQSRSRPVRRMRRVYAASVSPGTKRRRLLEDHYRVDPGKKVILPGVPKHEDDWARDVHDFFNLIVLVPVVVLNVMNWNWDMLLDMPPNKTIKDAWTGDWFEAFFFVTALYFVLDLMWIIFLPKCVSSPAVILQHHLAALVYIMVPYFAEEAQWGMGACMSVEINTWFLIARRVFNKQGFSPWVIDLPPLFSLKVKLISILFYTTWIFVRCYLYPLLWFEFHSMWQQRSKQYGTKYNLFAISLPLHTILCILNLKWTYDLINSKIRYWRLAGSARGEEKISKGL